MDSQTRMSARCKMALAVLAAACSQAFAVGLGSIQVQSGLNQALQVSIPVFGTDVSNIGELCPKAKVESFDGILLARPQVSFNSSAQAPRLIITTTQSINEPAVVIHLEIGCGTSVRRNYQILLDPVATTPSPLNARAFREPADAAVNGGGAVVAPLAASTGVRASIKNEEVENLRRVKALRSTRKKEPARDSVENGIAMQSRHAAEKSGPTVGLNPKKLSRSVLRLSNDLAPIDSTSMLSGMKLSDSLNGGGAEVDPQKADELRAAQLRFAAIVRGEDPEKNARIEANAALDKIQILEKEAAQIRQQSETARRAFEEQQKKSLNVNWFIGLAALLLVCFAALGWLGWRLAQIEKMRRQPFWRNGWTTDDAEPDDEHENPGSPFVDTVADFDASGPLSDEALLATSEPDRSDDVTAQKPPSRLQSVAKGISESKPSEQKTDEHPVAASADILPLQKPLMVARRHKRSEMIKVEEISDALEEAEFWMSLRDPQRAINVLEQYGAERPNSPMAWLYLLQLYRDVDDRTKYEALLNRFKRHFNSKAPEWDAKVDEASTKGLDGYPHLLKQICDLWGSDQAGPFLANLLFNIRTGQREGFDLPAYLDLILLANIAYEIQPSDHADKPFNVTQL